MNKKNKEAVYSKVHTLLDSFYQRNGFEYQSVPFSYKKNGLFVFWGASADYPDWSSFSPRFRVENNQTNALLKEVFPNQVAYITSLRVQSAESFAHEFGVSDFDNSPYNHCNKTCIYFYKIGLDTDLDPIVQDHINFMEKVTFPYFKKLSTIGGINEYFNNRLLNLSEEDLTKESTMRSFQKEEVLSAIVAAHLETDTRFDEICSKYKQLYNSIPFYLDDINKLETWLRENPKVI